MSCGAKGKLQEYVHLFAFRRGSHGLAWLVAGNPKHGLNAGNSAVRQFRNQRLQRGMKSRDHLPTEKKELLNRLESYDGQAAPRAAGI